MSKEKEMQLISKLFTNLLEPKNPLALQHKTHDLFVQVNPLNGEVKLFNDDDECLDSLQIYAWQSDDEELKAESVEMLKASIKHLQTQGFWDNLLFDLPFSIELVDENFATKEVLFFLDDDIVPITQPLLEGHKEELADFLQTLFEE